MIGRALSAGERLILNYLDEGFQLLAREARTPIDIGKITSLLDRAREGTISVGTAARGIPIGLLPPRSLPRQIIHELRGSNGQWTNLLSAVTRIHEARVRDFELVTRLFPPKAYVSLEAWASSIETFLVESGHPVADARAVVGRMFVAGLSLLP